MLEMMPTPKHSKRIADRKRKNKSMQNKTGSHDWKDYAPKNESISTNIEIKGIDNA